MTKKEYKETKNNLDDMAFVVEALVELYPYVGNGKKYEFAEIELKAKTVYYSLQRQLINKLPKKNEVNSIK